MAIIANFKVSGCTVDKYEAVLRELDAIGVGAAPKGQLYHVCYGSHDNLQVVDVFDSVASLDSFGKAWGRFSPSTASRPYPKSTTSTRS